jgi:DHA1 family tetracycline resistance protein-like MFS transporter
LKSLLLVLVVLIVGHGATNPSISSLISQAASTEDQGGILGVAQSLASLARIHASCWGGFTFDALASVSLPDREFVYGCRLQPESPGSKGSVNVPRPA